MKLKNLKVNSARAETGDWVGDLPDMDDLRLKVRGFSNADFGAITAREAAKVTREQREGGRRDGAPLPEVRERIMVKAMVETILLDWDGLTDDGGAPIPYTKETATTLLSDPDCRPFRDAVSLAAARVEEFTEDQVEAVAGN